MAQVRWIECRECNNVNYIKVHDLRFEQNCCYCGSPLLIENTSAQKGVSDCYEEELVCLHCDCRSYKIILSRAGEFLTLCCILCGKSYVLYQKNMNRYYTLDMARKFNMPYKPPPKVYNETPSSYEREKASVAKQNHEQALELYGQGKFSEAIKIWKKAYSVGELREPKTTINRLLSVSHKNKSARQLLYKIISEGKLEEKFEARDLYDLSVLAKSFDDSSASEILNIAAEKGHPEAMRALAESTMFFGDVHESLEYAIDAYDKGDEKSLHIIIELLNSKNIVFKDVEDVLQNGYLRACYGLAEQYEIGEYLDVDVEKAILLYKIGKNCGHSGCKETLKSLFVTGHYRPSSQKEILSFYTELANDGYDEYQYLLGRVYDDGRLGQIKDFELARKLYEVSALQGNREAQLKMGRMFEFGKGGVANNVDAYVWYSIAASKGSNEAASYRDELEKKMPLALIEKAQKKAIKMKKKMDNAD